MFSIGLRVSRAPEETYALQLPTLTYLSRFSQVDTCRGCNFHSVWKMQTRRHLYHPSTRMNVGETIELSSLSKNRLIIVIIDDFKKLSALLFFASRSRFWDALALYRALVENEQGKVTYCIRLDQAGDHTSSAMAEVTSKNDIVFKTMHPHTPVNLMELQKDSSKSFPSWQKHFYKPRTASFTLVRSIQPLELAEKQIAFQPKWLENVV